MNEMFENFLKRLNGAVNTVYMGIGEVKLSDDGVGPYIISELLNYSNKRFLFINAGTWQIPPQFQICRLCLN